ncbi:MAG: DUF87 domain-containing protein [Gammaproteobacteria bacterium]|nr:DUF87 domain-containing protein [Gammaproteobacteria bacterium]MCW5582973.1 DUF87 domain-containing protein [Gammaproteobacteria bacterium]
MKEFFEKAKYQDSPLRALTDFLSAEESNKNAKKYNEMRFVGHVLEIGFDQATLITSDPYKKAVGGIPRGSYLIMAPDSLEGLPPHFSLLRVADVAATPLSEGVKQTYFELHKKSMPELDIWTESELQWGALKATVLGMFYPNLEDPNKLAFSGDVNNVVSAHRYKVYAPNKELLDLIVNGIVRDENKFSLGKLRLTECALPFANQPQMEIETKVSTLDFRGFRTAMFGKTRLGKSNVVKLIAQGILETSKANSSVGQLIFDINGEYANDNPQDGNKSIRSAYSERCNVYALTPRDSTPSKPLRLNFYEQPHSCIEILASMLRQDGKTADYIKSFSSVQLPNIDEIGKLSFDEKTRAVRKVQIYWAILKMAGFDADEGRLKKLGLYAKNAKDFSPHFKDELRNTAYQAIQRCDPPEHPNNLDALVNELTVIARFKKDNPDDANLKTSSGKFLFDSDDNALLDFLVPKFAGSSGPIILRSYLVYHASNAGDFKKEILKALDAGRTVILDLGSATETTRRYFSDMLSQEVFKHQESKFVNNALGAHFVQLYFEEAHNIFPKDDKDITGVYTRFAKEGAKFHIGMVYSTQSPSTISRELLAQTENFFVGHLSSQVEAAALAKMQIAYEGLEADILKTRTPGYMRMLTFSHRFVIPMQANKFEAVVGRGE